MALSQTKLIKISQKTNGRCFYCNKSGEVVDHFIAKSRDDIILSPNSKPDDLENLFLACKRCNSSKHNKLPEDFTGNYFKIWDRFYRANHRIGECIGFFIKISIVKKNG